MGLTCSYLMKRYYMWLQTGALTGITWQDAGKVELVDGSSYLAQPLPFSISTLIRIKVLVTGYIEFQHNAELDSEAFVPINESLDFMCVLNGCLDLMQAENVEKLISAKSSSSAGAALEGIHASLCPPFKG
ncbi:unnamed protein product [Brassica oleracea]